MVIVSAELPEGKVIEPRAADVSLEVRRVPVRFVPPGTLAAPETALGLEPDADISAGSYLQAQHLDPPREDSAAPGLAEGRAPVEIAVSGAGALPASTGSRVDVVVTTEPQGAGPGRTYIAAGGVPLLGLRPGKAILALRRGEALRLIAAQNFARQVTLLPSG